MTELLLGVVVTAASIQDRDAAHRLLAALRGGISTSDSPGSTAATLGDCPVGLKSFLPFGLRSSNAAPAAPDSSESPGLGSRAHVCLDQQAPPLRPRLQNRPDHHQAVIHIAIIGVMIRRLART
ncbi:hypothetical protein ACFWAY_49295 [Rhodococcus sp. NPDC059968]|uniref:hypothetical protein n=1 Tax=Rhodococcus sp. NPDC059968 TaxID=3347017 RepID=UPI003672CA43